MWLCYSNDSCRCNTEMLRIDSDEPCGICSEVKDVNGLLAGMRYFLDNEVIAREYGNRARKRVMEQYSIPYIWEQLIEIWSQCS